MSWDMKLNHTVQSSNNQTMFLSTTISWILSCCTWCHGIPYKNHVSFTVLLVWLAIPQKSMVKHNWFEMHKQINLPCDQKQNLTKECSLCFPWEIKTRTTLMIHKRKVGEAMPDYHIHLMDYLSEKIVLHSHFSRPYRTGSSEVSDRHCPPYCKKRCGLPLAIKTIARFDIA